MAIRAPVEPAPHIAECLHALRVLRRNEPVTFCEGRVQDGATMVDRVAALSTGLRNLGLKPGERVAIGALNSERYLEWLLAVPAAGGIIAPLNHRWSLEEACEAVREIDATVLAVDDECLGWCSEFRNRCPSLTWLVFIGSRSCSNNSLIDENILLQLGGQNPELKLHYSPDSVALICFTSGTSGRPKGVCLSHNALLVQSWAKISLVGYSAKDVRLENFLGVPQKIHRFILKEAYMFRSKRSMPDPEEFLKLIK